MGTLTAMLCTVTIRVRPNTQTNLLKTMILGIYISFTTEVR